MMYQTQEIWRDPNTTVESLSADIGTNRIYVANSIRENTGLTFNDFLNKKRVEFMGCSPTEYIVRN